MGEAVAMAAKKVASRRMQLTDAPTTGDPIYHPRTDEIRPCSSEAAGSTNDLDTLGYVLPFAAMDAHTVGKVQSILVGSRIDIADLLAIARPLAAADPAGVQAALAV
jgi:hypothetical protein